MYLFFEIQIIYLFFYFFFGVVGGLLNATCGNATELIIAILALTQRKIDVVKYSLLGSVLSNLLLVLGTSLFCGGIANMRTEQNYDRVTPLSFKFLIQQVEIETRTHNKLYIGSLKIT